MKPGRKTILTAAVMVTTILVGAGCGRRSPTDATRPPSPSVTLVPLTNMVLIKAGSFTRINQRVTLSHDFWLGKYEVTQADYSARMAANPSHFTGDPRLPVEKVSEADATAFCAELTRSERAAGHLPAGYEYRLPTEAEWEYACRAGSTNLFSFGDDEAAADAHAWTEENSGQRSHPVGGKSPNAWGLHDMHGNVWEWCQDWFADYPDGVITDPAGPDSGEVKVFRGGSWNHAAKFARCSSRFMMAPTHGIHFVGFRVALGVELPTTPPASNRTNAPPTATP